MFYKIPSPNRVLFYKGTPRRRKLPARFTVCVWNLHKCKDPGFAPAFAACCARADLFLTQEAVFRPGTDNPLLLPGLEWAGAVSFLSLRRHTPIGIATGCRAPALQSGYRAQVLEPFFKMPKMALATVYDTENGPLLVLNIHAINFKGLNAFKLYLAKAAELLAGFPGAVLVAGDFNTWSGGRLTALKQAARALNLQEAVFEPDARKRFWGRPVDFLFTRGLQINRAWVEQTAASDHHPLWACLSIE